MQAILFDFDLTLADSSEGIFECTTYALEKLELEIVSRSAVVETIGSPLPVIFETITAATIQKDRHRSKNGKALDSTMKFGRASSNFPVVREIRPCLPSRSRSISRVDWLASQSSTLIEYSRLTGRYAYAPVP